MVIVQEIHLFEWPWFNFFEKTTFSIQKLKKEPYTMGRRQTDFDQPTHFQEFAVVFSTLFFSPRDFGGWMGKWSTMPDTWIGNSTSKSCDVADPNRFTDPNVCLGLVLYHIYPYHQLFFMKTQMQQTYAIYYSISINYSRSILDSPLAY